jgi:hypothetical protein
MTAFGLLFGEGWPVRLRVIAVGQRKKGTEVARVVAHPLQPTELYWSSTATPEAQPNENDPRPYRPVFGQLLGDHRWDDGNLPIRVNGRMLSISRSEVVDAMRSGQRKLTIRTGTQPSQ